MLYSRFLLIYFLYSSMYMSIPISQFIIFLTRNPMDREALWANSSWGRKRVGLDLATKQQQRIFYTLGRQMGGGFPTPNSSLCHQLGILQFSSILTLLLLPSRFSHVQLCDPMDCCPPGSSAHGIPQARILERVAVSFCTGSSQPKDQTHVSCVSCIGMWVLYHWHHRGSPNSDITLR